VCVCVCVYSVSKYHCVVCVQLLRTEKWWLSSHTLTHVKCQILAVSGSPGAKIFAACANVWAVRLSVCVCVSQKRSSERLSHVCGQLPDGSSSKHTNVTPITSWKKREKQVVGSIPTSQHIHNTEYEISAHKYIELGETYIHILKFKHNWFILIFQTQASNDKEQFEGF